MQFNAMGYHTAVLRYSCAPAEFPTALLELSKAVAYLRTNAAKWAIDPERIAVLGFSAGGHLAASLGVFWNTKWFAQIRKENGVDLSKEEIRPDGLLLAYPVISSGEFAHRDSFVALLGEARSEDPAWNVDAILTNSPTVCKTVIDDYRSNVMNVVHRLQYAFTFL